MEIVEQLFADRSRGLCLLFFSFISLVRLILIPRSVSAPILHRRTRGIHRRTPSFLIVCHVLRFVCQPPSSLHWVREFAAFSVTFALCYSLLNYGYVLLLPFWLCCQRTMRIM